MGRDQVIYWRTSPNIVDKCYSTTIKETHMKFESKFINYIHVSFSFKFSVRKKFPVYLVSSSKSTWKESP